MNRYQLGRLGEQEVAKLLYLRGWLLLEKNYRRIGTEIDLIATKSSTLLAIEVKSRRSPTASETVLSKRKVSSLRIGIDKYLSETADRYETIRCLLAVVLFRKGLQTPSDIIWQELWL